MQYLASHWLCMLYVGHLLESADEHIEWHNVPRA